MCLIFLSPFSSLMCFINECTNFFFPLTLSIATSSVSFNCVKTFILSNPPINAADLLSLPPFTKLSRLSIVTNVKIFLAFSRKFSEMVFISNPVFNCSIQESKR